ncbi:MAG: hypothetical protein AAB403_11390 [Planctomycetota bacterium]
MRKFLRDNAHLAWMAPFVLAIAWVYSSRLVSGPVLFFTLASLECLSLGIHQFVHHHDTFFGRPYVMTAFAGLTVGFILVPLLC